MKSLSEARSVSSFTRHHDVMTRGSVTARHVAENLACNHWVLYNNPKEYNLFVYLLQTLRVPLKIIEVHPSNPNKISLKTVLKELKISQVPCIYLINKGAGLYGYRIESQLPVKLSSLCTLTEQEAVQLATRAQYSTVEDVLGIIWVAGCDEPFMFKSTSHIMDVAPNSALLPEVLSVPVFKSNADIVARRAVIDLEVRQAHARVEYQSLRIQTKAYLSRLGKVTNGAGDPLNEEQILQDELGVMYNHIKRAEDLIETLKGLL